LPWEMYDIFVFNLDEDASNAEADAVSRPSRPYIPPDRGFGHGGYPAISMTTQGAVKFCEWLSAKTGRTYRVPTVAQWRLAALAGSKGAYSFGPDAEDIDEYAWTINTSPEKTQPLAQLKPNNYGLYDVEGNVMEWARDGDNFVACGGSYINEPEDASAFSIAEQDWEWNMTDPQIPKSPWWLSDASWVGLRIICDDETVGEAGDKGDD
jgi:formylglycine-generating enzyme required for sulfatase activity